MERFIVGTGRCGSTLLSRMMAESRTVLSLFEVFAALERDRFSSSEQIEGRAFVDILSYENPMVSMVLSRGVEVEEITYPFGKGMRHESPGAIPWLLAACIPRLSDEPDLLYDEILAFARTLPSQPLGGHFLALFEWLTDLQGKEAWVERSGASIEAVESLNRQFPNARFLHIHRDPCEAALSMRNHPLGRTAATVFFGWTPDEIGDDPIRDILASPPPVEYFGRFITLQLTEGYRALARLSPEQYREVAFEDLVENPGETLADIANFFELDVSDDWIPRAASLSKGLPPGRFARLSREEQERLSGACEPASSLLGRMPRLWEAGRDAAAAIR